MGPTANRKGARAAIIPALALLACLSLAPQALAGPPTHLRNEALDIAGLNHACGVAVDSKGDVYLSSAGESKVKVFNPAHTELTSIANSNEPCGLAVDSKGNLYVSEKATGKVVRYVPNAYPFSGTPSYGSPTTIDASGNAKGIVVDPFDERLYVAKGTRIDMYSAEGTPGIDESQRVFVFEATGGTFTLEFKGKKTNPIVWDAEHPAVQKALEEVTTIGEGNVSVTQGPNAGNKRDHLVTFKGALGGADVELLKGDPSGLTGGANKLLIQDTCTKCVQGFSGRIGEGSLSNATGVAAYTYKVNEESDRYLFVADDGPADALKAFSGSNIRSLKLRRTIAGPKEGEDFGFGSAGAYLAVDPGNRNVEEKCGSVAEQACTAGHLLVYDATHSVIDEFEASGEFLDQLSDDALADAKPTAMAIDRSGGPNDGTIYATSGAGAAAKALAFGPLAAPSRERVDKLSHVVANAISVATDNRGDAYLAAGPEVHVFGPSGAEVAKFEDTHTPLGDLAVDSSGKVYVLEGKAQVTYYTPSAYPPVSGTTYARHEPPIATKADFGGESLLAIAVNPGPSAGKDHVFVTAGSVTHEHDAAASGSGLLVSKFAEGFASWRSIAVDGRSGNVYLGANAQPIFVFEPSGKEALAQISGAGCPQGKFGANPFLAVDQANGHALEFQPGQAAREYDASGACVAEFGESTALTLGYRMAIDSSCALHSPPLTEMTTPTCKEFDPANGTAYVAYDDPAPGSFDLTAYGPLAYGEAPTAQTGVATSVGGGEATVNGTVNPHAFDLGECKFEYLPDAQYISNGEAFAGAATTPCAESPAAIGKGSDPVAVHAELSGLDPDARYRFRLAAKNKYGESKGDAGLFGPPLATTESALPILYREATLRGEVDPSGLPSEYHFEYGTSEAYGQSTPTQALPPGDGKVSVETAITGLAEGTTYHFRIVAGNEAGTAPGADQTFETLERRSESCPANVSYRTGLSANLPDCRAYELITPAETNGLTFGAGAGGSHGDTFNSWLVVPRGPGAGERLSYFGGTLPGFEGNGSLDGYRASRAPGEHPAGGWSSELFSPSYAQAVPDLDHLLFQQGVSPDQGYSFWDLEHSQGTLAQGIYLRAPGGFELLGRGSLNTDPKATSRFISSGGAHVIFSSKEHLEEEAAPQGTEAVYDRVAGSPSAAVVSLKPDGSPFTAGEDAAYLATNEAGSAVLFKAGGALYLHREGQSTEIAEGPNTFAGVSEDGGRVFYAATSNGEAPATIFACDLGEGPCAGAGAHPPTEIAPDSVFVNVSPGGSRALFTSKDALSGPEENEAGEIAEAGERNLYAWEAQTETTRFVAQLDPHDFDLQGFGGIDRMNLGRWTAAINAGPDLGRGLSPTRAPPDGETLVFQSHAQLTAYDNDGHGEVYRYAPSAQAGERLLCVSCDPSGAPAGADALLQSLGIGRPLNRNTLIANLTDDGSKLFFESQDSLLPEDANGFQDVYEWRAQGTGSCKRAGGCLALISSGQGDTPSYLYGMSADGHDVFFRTQEKLVGSDVAGSPSIYDAREGGGIPEPSVEEICDGDACQSQSAAPSLAVPASNGSRDDRFEEPKPRCAKGKRRVKGRCVRPHRKRHHHRPAHRNRGAGR